MLSPLSASRSSSASSDTSLVIIINAEAGTEATIHVGGYVEFMEGGVHVGNRDLFVTPKIGVVPKFLPLGVARAKYMAYKNLARAAAPERVVKREMEP